MANSYQYGGPDRIALLGNTGLPTEAGTGITTGTGTLYYSSVVQTGDLITTQILIDITGLHSATTNLDIIGATGAANSHLGQVTAVVNGSIIGGRITCLETPATGDPDIDFYSATESTGVEDAAVTGLTETALYARAASWALGDVKALTAWPAANEYLYMAVGNTAVVGTYTAGRFLIELFGVA